MPALEASLGATVQPKTEATEATHTIVLEREGYWMAEKEATHTQHVDVEIGLPLGHPESPALEVHAQTVIVEPHPILGKLGGLEKVACMQPVAVELDLPGGQPGDPNVNARMHLASAEPEDLEIEGDTDLLEVEGEETAINATFEEDADPHVDLQGNGVSHPIMLKEDIFLTFSSSPLYTTSEAARTQCSPPIDTRTLAIKGPELTGRTDMALPPLNIPLPEKAAEPPDQPLPEQIRASVDAEGLLKPS